MRVLREIFMFNNKEYEFVSNYRDDERIRESFNELTDKTYGFNFRKWFDNGYWNNKYIPYSLLDGDRVVANVSVNIMDFIVLGERKTLIQLGTVMTDESYRDQGLNKFLLNKVIEEWEDKCDFIYLFANDTVLNFYPKFGFKKYNQYQCSLEASKEKSSEIIRKLNVDNSNDRNTLIRILNNKKSLAKLDNIKNTSLVMFYCIDFMKDNIYYIEEYDVIAICEYNKNEVILSDLFSDKYIALEKIINSLIKDDTEKVILGFSPKDSSLYKEELINDENDTLFIRCKKDTIFNKEKLMFPLLSHA